MKDKTLISTCNRPFLLLLLAAFITLECAYAQFSGRPRTHTAQPKRVDAPRTQMTVHEARKSLVESLSHDKLINPVREMKFDRHTVTFFSDVSGKPYNYSMSFAGMKKSSGSGRRIMVFIPYSV